MIVESILLCDSRESANRVYGNSVKSRIEQQIGVTQVFTKADVLAKPKAFSKTRFIFSTWGMPKFTEEEISVCFPSLECIFYAAGTVQAFARPFLQRGVRIVSAWAANAVPVAEVTVSQIILANKGYFAACPAYSQNTPHPPVGGIDSIYPGSFDTLVGIIGAGKVGSLVIRMLQAHRLKVLVYDPFLSAKRSQELGAEPASLERIFSECQVISNHMANNAQTVGMLNKKLFSLMRPTATFINTGRGGAGGGGRSGAGHARASVCSSLTGRHIPRTSGSGQPTLSPAEHFPFPASGRQLWKRSHAHGRICVGRV